MQVGHEQLDVCRLTIDYVACSYAQPKGLSGGDRHARDQLHCAVQPIALNIEDCLEAYHVLVCEQSVEGKTMRLRIVSMLTILARWSHDLREEPGVYGDYDNERGRELRPRGGGGRCIAAALSTRWRAGAAAPHGRQQAYNEVK